MQPEIQAELACKRCKTTFSVPTRFCPQCGYSQLQEAESNWMTYLWPVLIFYFLILIYLLGSGLFLGNSLSGFERLLWSDLIFSSLVLFFSLCYFKNLAEGLSLKKIKWTLLLLLIPACLLFAFAVYYGADYLNKTVFVKESEEMYSIYQSTAYPIFYTFLFTAVQPAIFEELAFRGFIYKNLEKISSPKAAIIVSAFMFAILHLSFISLIWLVPMGLVYALLRHKYQVLWYGMVAHFTHNSTVILIQLYEKGELFINP